MSGEARGFRGGGGVGWKKRAGARGDSAHLVEGDGEGEEDEHAGDEPRDEMRGHVVAVHVPRRDGEDDEHEQVYEDPDGLEHLAQHRPPSVPPVLVRAEDHRRTGDATRVPRKERLSRKDESTTRARWGWGTRRRSERARVARANAERSRGARQQRSRRDDDAARRVRKKFLLAL